MGRNGERFRAASEYLLLRRDAADHRGTRPRADRPHARRGARSRSSAPAGLVELCEELLSGRGEASGVALAREILARYAELDHRPAHRLLRGAGQALRPRPQPASMPPIAAWMQRRPTTCRRRSCIAPPSRGGRNCSAASTWRPAAPPRWCACASSCSTPWRIATISPPSTTISSICSRPGSTAASWCCAASTGRRRRVILEKIIRYEAVHEIQDWDDLRRRIDPPDRRCYAFFHPALVDEPLIFVEVALTRDIPGGDRADPVDRSADSGRAATSATTAVFYSISNCQRGLARRLVRQFPDQAGGGGDLDASCRGCRPS